MCYGASMKPVFYVKKEEADLARTIENKLLALPLGSGILFVGVSVDPTEVSINLKVAPNKPPLYKIWVGCHRDYEELTIRALVHMILKDEIDKGLHILVEAHRGLGRSYLKSC